MRCRWAGTTCRSPGPCCGCARATSGWRPTRRNSSSPLARVIEAVVDGLGDEWEERSGHADTAASAFAARLRSDQHAHPHASWHTVTASRDEVAAVWSALNESANADMRLRPDGVSVWDVRDLADDFFSQIPH